MPDSRRLYTGALLASTALLGLQSGCQGYWDADGDGFSVTEGDCNDESASIGPLATEVCDGLDQNCNDLVDESSDAIDLDGDGFVPSFSSNCPTADYNGLLQGDCREGDALTHPGAEDEPGDGFDADCGGGEGPDPHVGINERSVSLEQALSVVADGSTIWLGEADISHQGLTLSNRTQTLRSVGFATSIVSEGGAPGLSFAGQDDSNLTLRDIDLKDGIGTLGGSLAVTGGHLTLTHVSLSGGIASKEGGCLYLAHAVARFDHVQLEACSAGSAGGALSALQSDLTFADGAVSSSVLLPDALGEGGAVLAQNTTLTLTRVELLGNLSPGSGGGLSIHGGYTLLQNVSIVGNQASGLGGGAVVREPQLFECLFCLVASNQAASGAGLLLQASADAIEEAAGPLFRVRNSILAYNIGRNLTLSSPSEDILELEYSDLYSVGGQSYGLKQLSRTNLEVYPGFARFTNDLNSENDDLHLHPGSPLLAAADPLETNPDGARADMGPGGGPEADRRWYEDLDADTLPDGWELRSSFSLAVLTASADPDEDGAAARDELRMGLAPFVSDTDEDGSLDGDELAAGSDAADWFSRPGEPYPVTVRLSAKEPVLQATLNRISYRGRIELDPGTWQGPLVIQGREVTLVGAYGADRTILEGTDASTISAIQATLELEGLSFVGGTALAGAALSLSNVDASLANLTFLDNRIEDELSGRGGAAIYITGGSLSLEASRFEGQTAMAAGGALYANASTIALSEVEFRDIWALRAGGALYLNGSELSGESLTFSGVHSEEDGGAIAALGSSLDLRDIQADETSAGALAGMGGFLSLTGGSGDVQNILIRRASAEHGGGIAVAGATLRGENLWLESTYAAGEGAGLILEDEGYADLRNLLVLGGSAVRGAGVYISCASGLLQNITVTGGAATQGGGIYVTAGSSRCPATALQLTNGILAYNQGYNLYAEDPRIIATTYSDFFSPPDQSNHNLPVLVSSNLTLDPGFLRVGSDGVPTDVHLRVDSPIRDLGSPVYLDLDTSRSDPGVFGGAQGGGFDLDLDGFPGYFWPGTYTDAPSTVKSYLYDCQDREPLIQICDG